MGILGYVKEAAFGAAMQSIWGEKWQAESKASEGPLHARVNGNKAATEKNQKQITTLNKALGDLTEQVRQLGIQKVAKESGNEGPQILSSSDWSRDLNFNNQSISLSINTENADRPQFTIKGFNRDLNEDEAKLFIQAVSQLFTKYFASLGINVQPAEAQKDFIKKNLRELCYMIATPIANANQPWGYESIGQYYLYGDRSQHFGTKTKVESLSKHRDYAIEQLIRAASDLKADAHEGKNPLNNFVTKDNLAQILSGFLSLIHAQQNPSDFNPFG